MSTRPNASTIVVNDAIGSSWEIGSIPESRWGRARRMGESLAFALVGREDELARCIAMLDAVRAGGGGSLVVTGEPGIGKSTLLRAVERLAPDFLCVWVSGVESEQPMAYAGLHQAFAPLRERIAELPDVQQEALGRALGWARGPAEPERFLVAAATMSLIAAVARRRPVLVVADDAQWVDPESAAAFAFAARRLEEDQVCFIWAARDRSTLGDLPRDVPELALSGLGREAAHALIGPRVAPRVADQLAVDTGGNPLGLLEISSRLDESQRLGAAPLPDRLPLGERLEGDYQHLLSRLSDPARRAVLLCALDRAGSISTVAGALAAEGHDSDAALDEAVERGVLVRRSSGLAFRHPLLRSAAVSGATPSERREAHLQLATTLSTRSLPSLRRGTGPRRAARPTRHSRRSSYAWPTRTGRRRGTPRPRQFSSAPPCWPATPPGKPSSWPEQSRTRCWRATWPVHGRWRGGSWTTRPMPRPEAGPSSSWGSRAHHGFGAASRRDAGLGRRGRRRPRARPGALRALDGSLPPQ